MHALVPIDPNSAIAAQHHNLLDQFLTGQLSKSTYKAYKADLKFFFAFLGFRVAFVFFCWGLFGPGGVPSWLVVVPFVDFGCALVVWCSKQTPKTSPESHP